jgi:hypothetical protein
MIGQSIINVESGGRGHLSDLLPRIALCFVSFAFHHRTNLIAALLALCLLHQPCLSSSYFAQDLASDAIDFTALLLRYGKIWQLPQVWIVRSRLCGSKHCGSVLENSQRKTEQSISVLVLYFCPTGFQPI